MVERGRKKARPSRAAPVEACRVVILGAVAWVLVVSGAVLVGAGLLARLTVQLRH
jgi:hypothetical protein